MQKALLLGFLAGMTVYFISVSMGLKTHIGGDLMAAVYTAASVATSEEKRKGIKMPGY